jgi:hypothetical protein
MATVKGETARSSPNINLTEKANAPLIYVDISAKYSDDGQLEIQCLGTSWLGKGKGVCRNLALIDRTIAKKLGGHLTDHFLLTHEVEVAVVL